MHHIAKFNGKNEKHLGLISQITFDTEVEYEIEKEMKVLTSIQKDDFMKQDNKEIVYLTGNLT